MKRYVTYGVLLLVVVGLFYYWRPIPVNRTYQGWLYTYDGAVDEAVEIRLQGTLYRSLFSHHGFEGQVVAKGVAMNMVRSTPGNLKMVWASVRERWNGQGKLSILGDIDGEGHLRTFGVVRFPNNLRALAGQIHKVEGIYPEQYIQFAAPANNAEESKQIAKQLNWGK